ncbi:substrate-binding domain-containing protein [Panacibacter sp. DH6]|uniref:Substrate-binding domain-containing protein n=1 Tax=Panacibacter microcysteis TaxID=2793269 RepID=A0A931E727_9BACT|nr:substrate-binding domain-containing protein [Panacibacter microcysteis]MBG9374941.1 substrate-binding domain-containing protein [Panacibacter microcysteis]
MKKKVSLKDIAQKVGVSIALVSYVLNNKNEKRISKDVATKIRETAAALNYRANQIAKSLKTNKTNTIGLIVSDIANPFSSSLARIIEDEADKYGYTVIFGSSDEDAEKSKKLIDTLTNRQVDGLIIAPADDTVEQVKMLVQEGFPFVLVDRYFPEVQTNYVALDNFKAAQTATGQLLHAGFKNIGLITYKSTLHNLQERKTGYIATLKAHGREVKKHHIKEIGYHETGPGVEKAMQQLLGGKDVVDAILFGSNILALQGVKYINARGLRVPENVGVIMFDESEALSLYSPPISYIKQPMESLGKTAVNMLLESIARNNKTSQVKLDGELVLSRSAVAVTESVV